MPWINIDVSGVLPAIGFNEDEVKERLYTLAEMARGEWIRVAQKNLGSSSIDYIAGIQPVFMGPKWAMITLTGSLPNDIENGKGPYDMKPGLLAGPNAKTTKGGVRVNTVPFRHGTPGTTGKRVGAPMPLTHMTDKGKKASFIYTAAKKLKVSTETAWGGRTDNFGGYGMKTQMPVSGGRPGAYSWKSSPYAGMVKIAKTYGKKTQHQYATFRRVSDNSDPNSWWHPGIEARHFAVHVSNYIQRQIGRLL
jgi:hypothetical protein